jgi:hypothetical protein
MTIGAKSRVSNIVYNINNIWQSEDVDSLYKVTRNYVLFIISRAI